VIAEVEALICELRRQHPRWGARRISFELSTRGLERPPSRKRCHGWGPLLPVESVFADGGYTGRPVAWAEAVLALAVQIVKRTDTTAGFVILPRRWVVERSFGWLVKHRRTVRDYETRPDCHEAIVYIAAIHTLTRRLARSTDRHT
jgi:transposase